MPGLKQISENKFGIEDIADHSAQEKSNQRRSQEELLISSTKRGWIEQFMGQDYNVLYDPPGYGNCQFSALCFAFRSVGLYCSSETLKREVVPYLNSNSVDVFYRGSMRTIPSIDGNGSSLRWWNHFKGNFQHIQCW